MKNGRRSKAVRASFLPLLASLVPGFLACDNSGSRITENCDTGGWTPIPRIQGDGATSPLEGEFVTTRGIVVGNFLGAKRLNGFFLEAKLGDDDPKTSDGIFVYAPGDRRAQLDNLKVGDLLQVKGEVTEFHGLTELADVRSIQRLGRDRSVATTPVRLPVTSRSRMERYEGMLITFPQTLTVSGNYHLGEYGQVTLASGGRLYQPTQLHHPGSPEASALAARNRRRRVVLDDGRQPSNPPQVPYLGHDGTLRIGDTVTDVTGVLGYGPVSLGETFRDYRLHPTQPPEFKRVNARRRQLAGLSGNLRVAGFNVRNFFTTLADGRNASEPRGARNRKEFQRQRRKLANAIAAMDAAVVGLMEIENNGTTAINNLVAAINAQAEAEYKVVPAPPEVSDDAIKVSLIYRPGRVERLGESKSASDPVFNRAPVAQTFVDRRSGAEWCVIVNHWKSKAPYPPPTGRDKPQGDGQGAYNATRTAQAHALLRFIETLRAETSSILVLGDLNAYAKEDPIRALREKGGLVDEIGRSLERPYSYTFAARAGYLDYALTSPKLSEHVAGVTIWHINADEPPFLDYRMESSRPSHYGPSPFRSSDHDPVILSLRF